MMRVSRPRRLIAALLFVCISLVVVPQGEAKAIRDQELALEVGEQTIIRAENVMSYSEGTSGIVDIRVAPDGAQFVVVGVKAGVTSLLLLHRSGDQTRYRIRVAESRAPAPPPPTTSTTSNGRIEVPRRINVRLDFYFVSLSESYSHQIGVGWPGTVGGQGVFQASAVFNLKTGSLMGATASVVNQPLPRLDVAQANGWARVQRHALLITANGNPADYMSGGEVNLQVQGALTAEIRSIEFGSAVKVTPRYDTQSGRIDLFIEAEVSELEENQQTQVPGRIRSKLNTMVNMELGQGFILAGLKGKRSRNQKKGLPGLSQIPILGLMFGSDSEATEETENLLFIIPTVVEALPKNRRDLVDEMFQAYRDYGGNLKKTRMFNRVSPADYKE